MTARECGTQMERTDVLLDDSSDSVVSSRPYFSSIQLEELKRWNVVVVQRYWRGYIARLRTWTLRQALYSEYVAQQESLAQVRLYSSL
jgi:hypothetical protein